MSRRKGRILAFQALYSWDVGGVPKETLTSFAWAVNADNPVLDEETKAFATLLISGTLEHIEEIDASIKAHLSEKWDFSRLDHVALAILRMSVYSVLYQKDMPATIIMDEAISIAKEYGSDDAYKFINAMLDSIKKDLEVSKEG